MKLTSILVTLAVAVILQVTLARYTVGGRWVFDLVVVGVVFAGLQWGPVAGILSGTMGGLMQDVLSGEIVGVGGLAKTVVGCAAGAVGAQFVLVKPSARMLIVAGSTLVHRVIVLSLYGMIEQQWPVFAWGAMLGEIAINSIVSLFAFHAASVLPGVMERQRMGRRSSLSRRRW